MEKQCPGTQSAMQAFMHGALLPRGLNAGLAGWLKRVE